MDNLFDKKEYSKNIYVIKHKLNSLQKVPGKSYFEWKVEPFIVRIFTNSLGDEDYPSIPTLVQIVEFPKPQSIYLTQYEKVDVQLYEVIKKPGIDSEEERLISLWNDSRFNNYQPIMYDTWRSPTGLVNFSNGQQMPIIYVCELISYLYRLANLTAFM